MVGPPIPGPRIVLRDVEEDDAGGDYLAWMNDPELTRFLESRFQAYSQADLVSYVAAMRAHPGVRFLAVVRREDGRHIGNVKLGPIDHHHGLADIGILIGARDCWGQGFATETVATLAGWAFAELGLRKLTAGAYATNAGSVRAFQRAGFHVEGVRPDHYLSEGQPVDLVLLGRFRRDLPPPSAAPGSPA